MNDKKVIRGTRRGYRTIAIIVWPDGDHDARGDVPWELAARIRTKKAAAAALGMTVVEFNEAIEAAGK